ncbi:MAG: class I SAM-dependent methyltransferase [Candidatus Hydrogenedentes bacterium]|nr:class I SAM-dependent methyltransferase [Candidatus Hydrogenedentota bacterium]
MERDEYAIMFRVEDRHWWYHGLRAMLRRVWNAHVPPGRQRFLDVGCGTGANLAAFRDVADCYGIDFAFDAVRFCRNRDEQRTAAASALDLPFEDCTFDVVVSCDVVCHRSIANKGDAVREMCRVLKPGGLMIINLPAYQWLHSSHDTHVQTDHRFTRTEVKRMMSNAGLSPAGAWYWNSVLFPVILPTRLWRKLRPLPASDLNDASGEGMSPFFAGMLAIERGAMNFLPMPFGLSIMAAAKKK